MSIPSFYHPESLWSDVIPAGFHWSARIRRGTVLRLHALDAGANLSALFFNAEEKLERYNMPDTLKAQHTAFLTAGHVCYSDMGRVMCAILRDDTGWNDTFCGVSDAAQISERYGERRFGAARNGMYRNGRDGLLIEMGKWGLGLRDLVANINFFSKVSVDETGQLTWHADHCAADSIIELRFEMDTIVVLSSAPHPLDHRPSYQPAAVKLTAYSAKPIALDDPCRSSCGENQRGYLNNARYWGHLDDGYLVADTEACV